MRAAQAELTIDLPFNSAYRHAAWISFRTNHTKLQEYLPLGGVQNARIKVATLILVCVFFGPGN